MHTPYHHLSTRTLIRLQGNDTRKLLQGIITNNMDTLETEPAMFSALLTPQGKFLFDFFLIRDADGYLLDIDKCYAEALIKKLTMYRLRADMHITPIADWSALASMADEMPDLASGGIAYRDPRIMSMGWRIATPNIPKNSQDAVAYNEHRLSLGVPDGAQDAVQDKSLLLELGYDHLHAIDFHKGCYVGQEVTARTKYRGNLKKHLYQVTSAIPLPPYGTTLMQEDREVGEMRSSYGCTGLALIRDAAVETIDSTVIYVGDQQVIQAVRPAWWPSQQEKT